MDNVVRLSFYLSVWLSIAGGLLIFNRPDRIIHDAADFFDPSHNNLLFTVPILSINQLLLGFAQDTRDGEPEALLMGLLFLLVGGSLQYYGRMNGISSNDGCTVATFYVGLSPILFSVT